MKCLVMVYAITLQANIPSYSGIPRGYDTNMLCNTNTVNVKHTTPCRLNICIFFMPLNN